jgi:Zn-finger nucleic acid-binding protein
MNCPVCGVPLAEAWLGFDDEIAVDACRQCEGIWLDPGELDPLDESVRTDVEALPWKEADEERVLPCPRCVREHYRGTDQALLLRVELDAGGPAILHCVDCGGYFVTPDELELVRDHVLRVDSNETRGLKLWRKITSRDKKSGHIKVSWALLDADHPQKPDET